MKLFRLNPELFKDCKSYDELVGELGYPAMLQYIGFEKVRTKECPKFGKIIICSINKIDKELFEITKCKSITFHGELKIPEKDLIPI